MDVGNYTLSDLLGRGGTSEVYAGRHRAAGDAVAVKLLRTSLADDERVREAFVAEAARTREIQHPNVVRVLDFGHDPAAGCYLVMEQIDGETLATRLRRGPLGEATLREMAAAIADGMQAAHARGIVHRDLKPGNVMLRGDMPTIVDFGIAKSLGGSSVAVTERRIGTVAYMAPEQLTDGLITPAVDIWALGVILYEAATGRLPFDSFSDGRLPQLFESPPRVRTRAPISSVLDDLIARCLERDPARRPAAMADIARVLRGESDERVTEDIGGVARSRPASRRRLAWLALVLAAGAAVAVGFAMRGDDKQGAPAAVDTRAAESSRPIVETAPVGTPPPPTPVASPAPVETPLPAPEHKRVRSKPKKRTTSQGETLD